MSRNAPQMDKMLYSERRNVARSREPVIDVRNANNRVMPTFHVHAAALLG